MLLHIQDAAQNIAELRTSFDAVMNEASNISSQWGLPRQFSNKRTKKTKTFFDELSEGIALSDPVKRFRVTVFLPLMDIVSRQLINRFEGMKALVMAYQVFYQVLLILISRRKQKSFLTNLLITSLPCFLAKCFPLKRRLKKRLHI